MMAFKNLPPWGDFVKGHGSDMLRMHLAFTTRLQRMHRRTVAKHSAMKTAEQEDAAREMWSER